MLFRSIKTDIQAVDEDEIMQRFQKVDIFTYRYTEEWRNVRGVDDISVRGVIAQQLKDVFPEYVSVIDSFDLPDKNFTMDQMHQVDKQALVLDLVAAFKAHHRRFQVGVNSEFSSGDIKVSTAASDSYLQGDAATSNSGDVYVSSGGTEAGKTGDIVIGTGESSAGRSGSIHLSVGGSNNGPGGDVTLEAGFSTSQRRTDNGGSIHITSGGSEIGRAHV